MESIGNQHGKRSSKLIFCLNISRVLRKKLKESGKKEMKHIVNFSGGKEITAMLLRMKEGYKQIHKHYIEQSTKDYTGEKSGI